MPFKSAPRLIILNGPSSAGKSSIAKAIQKIDPSFLHVQLDMFLNMLSPEMLQDQTAFDAIQETLPHAVTALVKQGHNVVFDTVSIGKHFQTLRENFKSFDPFYIGVTAPLAVLKEREKARGDRPIGLAAAQFDVVHQDIVYDFSVNTFQQTADQAAVEIFKSPYFMA